MFKLKKDKYRKARGGKAFLISVSCASCGELVLHYQKDGDGTLKRCYLNRIMGPENLERLQHEVKITQPEHLEHLRCSRCDTVLGAPIRHHDGRLAFRLRRGYFRKERLTS